MTWLDKFKLNKQLVRSVTEAGYTAPKDIQLKTLSRINGGQDIIAIGPEGCGKTTAYVLAVLNRFNYNPEGVPLVLILVPDKERVEQVIAQFEVLNKNKNIAIVGLYAAPGIEAQMDALADGADIVVATPDRARAIYLKLGLNLNKIQLLILDDAELIVKQGLQLPTIELANSITKCQHLVFTEVMHSKLDKMIASFMKQPAIIEVEELGNTRLNLYPQLLYHLPDFATKLNLLQLFMQDTELFMQTAVFVNTRQTAEKIYKELQNRQQNKVALFNYVLAGAKSFTSVADFKASGIQALIITGEEPEVTTDLPHIPFLIHFELPETKEIFINRMISQVPQAENETLAITFTTDLELPAVRRIEQACGQKIPLAELPEGLAVTKEKKKEADKTTSKTKADEPITGAAFHEKKASNSKTYNYSSGEKARMNKKKKYG